ncbi:MAG: type II toxin-antitoxin system VapC family toxin [Nevskiaceae bacterium]|jgi:PIN domain nuclease of toxin-antitoxin system|nr:type II toxin-antitoxin system VapC family toxin [Nevskiaceae bacterium]
MSFGGTLLLDTHTFVWALSKPDRLSSAARQALENPANALFVSAASVWEMAIKFHRGKWPEAEPLVFGLTPILNRLRAKLWPIDGAHALRAGLLGWSHNDPFDRMLAAQALANQFTLVTQDEAFRNVPALSVLW